VDVEEANHSLSVS